MNIDLACQWHQGKKDSTIVAAFHTIRDGIVAWHRNGYTKRWMLKENNLAWGCATNLTDTIMGLVWVLKN